jgi:Phage capsid protein
MSVEITTAFVNEYKSGIEMLVQQMSSVLRSAVRVEPVTGKKSSFDQVGVVGAKKRTSRHADTPRVDTPHRRRWVTTGKYEVSDLLDEDDKIRVLNDPTNAYSETFAAAMARAMDMEVSAAALGTSVTGEDGEINVALPAGNIILAAATGFTLAKVKEASRRLKAGNAVDGRRKLHIAWTSFQENEFVDTPEVKSIDFNTQKVLMQGGVNEFYNFTFHRMEDWTDELGNLNRIIPKPAGERQCFAWVEDGLLLAIAKDITGRISELPTKSYSVQPYYCMQIGATRMQEPKVIQINCIEP